MPDDTKCPECGSPISKSGPAGGLCPRCLMKAGQGPTQTVGGARRFDPPTPERLAESFPQLEILELIGQGGMGAVYKARQPSLDRTVALKILAPQLVQDPAFAERFSREARTLAKLSHPHTVDIHDFVMEYVDGAALREVMRAGRLSAADALGLVPQLCDALQFAHDAGIVHRDIKPENILLDHAGNVKIADFGLAKLIAPDRADGVSLTISGAVMGTPAYMAPEQIEHPLDVDHRADIYAVGVVFYELLTGELPLGRFVPPSRKVEVDVRVDEVVLKALEKEPRLRYQHASEVRTEVDNISSTAAAPSQPAASPRKFEPVEHGQPDHSMSDTATEPPKGDATGGIIPYKNPPALIAYYCGVFSLIPIIGIFAGIPGIILGVMGLWARRTNPPIKGAVHAWIGIILGGFTTVLWGGLIIVMVARVFA
jgi:serine/threonine protein kinase